MTLGIDFRSAAKDDKLPIGYKMAAVTTPTGAWGNRQDPTQKERAGKETGKGGGSPSSPEKGKAQKKERPGPSGPVYQSSHRSSS